MTCRNGYCLDLSFDRLLMMMIYIYNWGFCNWRVYRCGSFCESYVKKFQETLSPQAACRPVYSFLPLVQRAIAMLYDGNNRLPAATQTQIFLKGVIRWYISVFLCSESHLWPTIETLKNNRCMVKITYNGSSWYILFTKDFSSLFCLFLLLCFFFFLSVFFFLYRPKVTAVQSLQLYGL